MLNDVEEAVYMGAIMQTRIARQPGKRANLARYEIFSKNIRALIYGQAIAGALVC